ncbi:hypothetical protein [Pseudomonas synxantha]|uniref:hypothetical protein n=1 Tax=Pseudomonas synxantha TaxID=47883 RepID=UPI001E3844CE|nr:hypothetical protein [Pseudomonas synxantha]
MQSPVPPYDGKPLAYIDQNVLDLVVKNVDWDFFQRLMDHFQVVYSDDTLREIKRSGSPEKFLDALVSLDAAHFKIHVTDKFEVTDEFRISHLSPHGAYANFCLIDPVYDMMLAATRQTTLKMFGGRKESDFEDIDAEQLEAFNELMGYITEQLNSIDEISQEQRNVVEQYQAALTSQYKEVLSISSDQMRQHVANAREWSGVRDYREATGAGPVELNNIKPPNVIEKIWAMYQNLDGYKGQGFTIEQFLGISTSPIYARDMFLHEKVTAIYNLLNFIGYHQDSKLTKEARHIAATSDAAHAAISASVSLILSCDRVFIKKVEAIYEHLQVNTTVGLVVVDDELIVVTAS